METASTTDSWEAFVDPDLIRGKLITAAIYIAAFDLLNDTIVGRIMDFYTNGFDQNGWRIDPEYQTRVLSKNRSPVYASLLWLKDEVQAITDPDITAFERIKKVRNDLAHALSGMLFKGLPSELPVRFQEMVSLLDQLERWWIVNVEIPTNPDLHGQENDEAGVIPGRLMGLRFLLDLALGTEEESRKYMEAFAKRKATGIK